MDTSQGLCAKFQLSRCKSGREIGRRRTEAIAISIVLIFLFKCAPANEAAACEKTYFFPRSETKSGIKLFLSGFLLNKNVT